MATATTTPVPPPTVDATHILALALRLAELHRGPAESSRRLALVELVHACDALPPGAVLAIPLVTPADEVERAIGDASYTLRAIDGTVTETTHDAHGESTTVAMLPEQVRQRIQDLAAVLAAAGARRG